MADADASLDILINPKLTSGDIKLSADQMRDLNAAVTSAQEKTKQLGKETVQAGENVNTWNTHGREMNRLIMEADRILPGMGEVLRAAFRPETLGIAGLVLLVREFVKETGEAKKAFEQLSAAHADFDVSIWNSEVQGISNARKVASEYAQDIAAILRVKGQVQEAQKLEDAVHEAEFRQAQELLKLTTQTEMVKAQGLPEEQRKIREAEIQAAASQQKSTLDLVREEQKLDDAKKHLAQLQEEEAKTRARSDAASAALGTAQTEPQSVEKARAALETIDTEIKAAQTARDKAAEDYNTNVRIYGETGSDYQKSLKDKIEPFQAALDAAITSKFVAQATIDSWKKQQGIVEDAAKTAKADFDKLHNAVVEATNKYSELAAVLGIDLQTAAISAPIIARNQNQEINNLLTGDKLSGLILDSFRPVAGGGASYTAFLKYAEASNAHAEMAVRHIEALSAKFPELHERLRNLEHQFQGNLIPAH